MTADDALFDDTPYRVTPPPPAEKLSPDRRRTQRQAAQLAVRVHPLSGAGSRYLRVHPDAPPADDRAAPGPRCGTCWFRQSLGYHNRTYSKCLFPESAGADEIELIGYPRVSHGAASDVRTWWPACVDYSPGDTAVSPDAARWRP